MDTTLTTIQIANPKPPKVQAAPETRKSGKELPVSGNSEPPEPPPKTIEKAVQQIQTYLSDSQRQLQFHIHEGSGRTVMTVLNPITGETIRQIPAEEVLKMAAAIQHEGLHFVSTTA